MRYLSLVFTLVLTACSLGTNLDDVELRQPQDAGADGTVDAGDVADVADAGLDTDTADTADATADVADADTDAEVDGGFMPSECALLPEPVVVEEVGDVTFRRSGLRRWRVGSSVGSYAFGMVGAERGDAVAFSRGSHIASTLFDHLDVGQGTVIMAVVPRWSGSTHQGRSTLFSVAGFLVEVVESDIVVTPPVGPVHEIPTGAVTWESGQPVWITLRWNWSNPLTATGGEHASLTIPAGTTFFAEQVPDLDELGCVNVVGAADTDGTNPANAIVQAFTVFRRVLFGSGFGNGLSRDAFVELAAITEANRSPLDVLASWDVVWSLPVVQAGGFLGPDDVVTHPHSANLLPPAVAHFERLDQLAGNADIVAADPSEQIFSRGASIVGDGQRSHPRVWSELSSVALVTPIVVRALAHAAADGDGVMGLPELTLRCRGDDSTAVSIVGSEASSPAEVDELILTFDAPNDVVCSAVELGIGNANTQGRVVFHTIDAQPNLVQNPGFQYGDEDAFEAWQPDPDNFFATLSGPAPGLAPPGARVEATTGVTAVMRQQLDFIDSRWFTLGAQLRRSGGHDVFVGAAELEHVYAELAQPFAGFALLVDASDVFVHVRAVGTLRNATAEQFEISLSATGPASATALSRVDADEVYAIALTTAQAVVYAPGLEDSTDDGGFVRIDNRDALAVLLGSRDGRIGTDVVWGFADGLAELNSCNAGGRAQLLSIGGHPTAAPDSNGAGVIALPNGQLQGWRYRVGQEPTFTSGVSLALSREAPTRVELAFDIEGTMEIYVDSQLLLQQNLGGYFAVPPEAARVGSLPEVGRTVDNGCPFLTTIPERVE